MSLGGGGKSSSKSSTTNIDKRLVVGDGGTGVSADLSAGGDYSTVNLSVLDGSAIASAFAFAEANAMSTGESLALLLGVASEALTQNAALVQSSGDLVATAYEDAKGQTADSKYLIAAALAIVGVVAVKALK